MKEEHILEVSEYLEKSDYDSIDKLLRSLSVENEEKDYNYWLLKAIVARKKNSETELIDSIIGGMKASPIAYEMYDYLGDYFIDKNKNKAYLCYEMASFYCGNEDKLIIRSKMDSLYQDGNISVKPVSIIIPSYNCCDMMKKCIQSIRDNNPSESYEIVVVDNASEDGILEWLKEQQDIVLIANSENVGFPIACNQGINAAKRDNDIFLLNNDTVVPLNAIFWLRMGLYESDSVGATGSVSNHVTNYQRVDVNYKTVEEYINWAYTNNVLSLNPYEKKLFLIGFALMMKRTVLDKIGLLDEQFSPGNYEDNDIGFRINEAGYQVLLCRNSFILHYGHTSFKKDPESFKKLLQRNKEYFIKKWGADFDYYCNIRMELIGCIKDSSEKDIKVLEIGCGAGATLSKIQYLYPNATVKGVELSESVSKMAGTYLDVIQGNIENMQMDYEEEYFDYIIFGDVLEHLTDPLATICKVRKYLKKDGKIIASIPNLLNYTVIVPLLKGHFKYEESGLLDKTHCHMFTRIEAIKMFIQAGFDIEKMDGIIIPYELSEEDQNLFEEIIKLPGVVSKSEFEVYQHIFVASRKEY